MKNKYINLRINTQQQSSITSKTKRIFTRRKRSQILTQYKKIFAHIYSDFHQDKNQIKCLEPIILHNSESYQNSAKQFNKNTNPIIKQKKIILRNSHTNRIKLFQKYRKVELNKTLSDIKINSVDLLKTTKKIQLNKTFSISKKIHHDNNSDYKLKDRSLEYNISPNGKVINLSYYPLIFNLTETQNNKSSTNKFPFTKKIELEATNKSINFKSYHKKKNIKILSSFDENQLKPWQNQPIEDYQLDKRIT